MYLCSGIRVQAICIFFGQDQFSTPLKWIATKASYPLSLPQPFLFPFCINTLFFVSTVRLYNNQKPCARVQGYVWSELIGSVQTEHLNLHTISKNLCITTFFCCVVMCPYLQLTRYPVTPVEVSSPVKVSSPEETREMPGCSNLSNGTIVTKLLINYSWRTQVPNGALCVHQSILSLRGEQ